ncbi:MAG TPA: hybrid sensor histidine kinase/response regulator [Deltaproteobacteria bacterium]|nr:hybrid sensor histidine kinase/response regulator [Deltaproteobacteria bacterium]
MGTLAVEQSIKPRILVVEDEKHERALLAELLSREGFYADEADDGREAMEKLEKLTYDLMLLDLKIPGVNGLELLRTLRAGKRDIPVIIMTGHADTDSAIKALNLGAEGFFRKPFEVDELMETVQSSIEKHRLTEALLRTAKMAELGELAVSAIHEIKNILATIKASAAALAKSRKLESGDKKIRLIKDSVDYADRVASYVFKVSMRADREEPVGLKGLFDTLLNLVGPYLEEKEIATVCRVGDHSIDGIQDSLHVIFLNLIINAIEAMDEGGTLTIASRRLGDAVAVDVTDTGRGMSKEAQARMFDLFFTTKKNRQSGFGLALVKREVERAGGGVSVKSEPGRGTTFTITLPAPPHSRDRLAT